MPQPTSRLTALALALLLGCTSYEAAPLDPGELLTALDQLRLDTPPSASVAAVASGFDAADGLTAVEASAVAVQHNPRLAALRGQVGTAQAQLIEAGLLPDPVIGWSAMEPLAETIVEGKVESPSWLAGFSLSWEVPKPGQIDAREGVARAQIDARAAQLALAEWTLVRDVHLAYVRLLSADARIGQTERLAEVATRARDFFQRARAAGAATALEDNLSAAAAASVEADMLQAQNERALAHQALNQLLGMPPQLEWTPQDSLEDFVVPATLPSEDPAALLEASFAQRPDLQQALAAYQRAEEQLRLEVAEQWPTLQIGTGVGLQVPIFSDFNAPAIRTAERARAAAGQRVSAAVHRVRAEVHAALARSEQAHALLQLFSERLAPQTAETLQLTERAFAAREVTPLEILTAQRQVIDLQGRHLSARRAWAESCIRLDAACGRLLPTLRTPPPTDRSQEAE